MAIAVEQQILRFQVPIDDVLAVQIIQCTDNLCCIEASCGSGEPTSRSQVGKQFASSDKLQ